MSLTIPFETFISGVLRKNLLPDSIIDRIKDFFLSKQILTLSAFQSVADDKESTKLLCPHDDLKIGMTILVGNRGQIAKLDFPTRFPLSFYLRNLKNLLAPLTSGEVFKELVGPKSRPLLITYVIFFQQEAIEIVTQGHSPQVVLPKDEIKLITRFKVPVGFGQSSLVNLHVMIWDDDAPEHTRLIKQVFSNDMPGQISSYMSKIQASRNEAYQSAIKEMSDGMANDLNDASNALTTLSPAVSAGIGLAAGTISMLYGLVDFIRGTQSDHLIASLDFTYHVQRDPLGGVTFKSVQPPNRNIYLTAKSKHTNLLDIGKRVSEKPEWVYSGDKAIPQPAALSQHVEIKWFLDEKLNQRFGFDVEAEIQEAV